MENIRVKMNMTANFNRERYGEPAHLKSMEVEHNIKFTESDEPPGSKGKTNEFEMKLWQISAHVQHIKNLLEEYEEQGMRPADLEKARQMICSQIRRPNEKNLIGKISLN